MPRPKTQRIVNIPVEAALADALAASTGATEEEGQQMATEYRLLSEGVRGGKVSIGGVVVAFDADGISDWISEEQLQAVKGVPGYVVFASSDTSPGDPLPDLTPVPAVEAEPIAETAPGDVVDQQHPDEAE